MSGQNYLMLVIGMGVVTYLPRLLPLVLLSRRRLPGWFAEWLELIPPALLSALLAPILLTQQPSRVLDLGRPELLAALPTLLFALKSRSLAGTVLFGMLTHWAITTLI